MWPQSLHCPVEHAPLLPLAPLLQLVGIIPEHCAVFKSALTPLRLAFRAQLPAGSGEAGVPDGGGVGSGTASPSLRPSLSGGELGGPEAAWEVAERQPSLTLGSPRQAAAGTASPTAAGGGLSRRQSSASGGGGGTRRTTSGSAEGQLSSPFGRRTSLHRVGTDTLMRQVRPWPHLFLPPCTPCGKPALSSAPAVPLLPVPPGNCSPASFPRVHTPPASPVKPPAPLLLPSPALQASVAAAPPPPAATVTLIYKKGDDLRQDQLVVQMFSLMDRWVVEVHGA